MASVARKVSGPTRPAAKIFVGGISYETTDGKLREYFSQYGEVADACIMKDAHTRRSRGFGFVTFADADSANRVLAETEHIIDARKVEAKPAVPKSEVVRETPPEEPKANTEPKNSAEVSSSRANTNKIFVGGLHYDTTSAGLGEYFGQFGDVLSSEVMYNRDTGKSRGFGFIVFAMSDEGSKAAASAIEMPSHVIDGKLVEVKAAVPKHLSPNNRSVSMDLNHGDKGKTATPRSSQSSVNTVASSTSMPPTPVGTPSSYAAALRFGRSATNATVGGLGADMDKSQTDIDGVWINGVEPTEHELRAIMGIADVNLSEHHSRVGNGGSFGLGDGASTTGTDSSHLAAQSSVAYHLRANQDQAAALMQQQQIQQQNQLLAQQQQLQQLQLQIQQMQALQQQALQQNMQRASFAALLHNAQAAQQQHQQQHHQQQQQQPQGQSQSQQHQQHQTHQQQQQPQQQQAQQQQPQQQHPHHHQQQLPHHQQQHPPKQQQQHLQQPQQQQHQQQQHHHQQQQQKQKQQQQQQHHQHQVSSTQQQHHHHQQQQHHHQQQQQPGADASHLVAHLNNGAFHSAPAGEPLGDITAVPPGMTMSSTSGQPSPLFTESEPVSLSRNVSRESSLNALARSTSSGNLFEVSNLGSDSDLVSSLTSASSNPSHSNGLPPLGHLSRSMSLNVVDDVSRAAGSQVSRSGHHGQSHSAPNWLGDERSLGLELGSPDSQLLSGSSLSSHYAGDTDPMLYNISPFSVLDSRSSREGAGSTHHLKAP